MTLEVPVKVAHFVQDLWLNLVRNGWLNLVRNHWLSLGQNSQSDYSGESEPPFWCKLSHPDLRWINLRFIFRFASS